MNKQGEIVGAIGKASFGGQHVGAVFKNLSLGLDLKHFPNLSNFYGLAGTSYQAVSATFLQAGYRGTILEAGAGVTRYFTSLMYGPYGGGATFNPSLHRPLYQDE